MRFIKSTLLLGAAATLSLVACEKAKGPAADSKSEQAGKASDPISSAVAAAPVAVSSDATIMVANADGTTKVVRQGHNGWTCMPDNPGTPGHDPMCMDANALKWAMAWMAHKDPPADSVGLIYMLSGGSDASNMDPWGTKPEAGHKWVETGPHVMVVGSPSLNALYPSGPQPDTTRPYVMFGGTPYAHVMIPVT